MLIFDEKAKEDRLISDKTKTNLPQIMLIPLEQIEEDPLNNEAFSLQEIESLARDMQEDGFFGDIAVYPLEQTGENERHYRIESGHRRFRAAKMAGLKEIPASVTVPPKNMIERRLRLTQWNLHGRTPTPMDSAKLVGFTYDTFAMMKQQGFISGSLLERTAKELDISTSNVSKYKMLLTLEPSLQRLVEEGKCSWAILAQASQLPADNQNLLYRNIVSEMKLGQVTGAWLSRRIDEYRHIRLKSEEKYIYRREDFAEVFAKPEDREAAPLPGKEKKQSKAHTSGDILRSGQGGTRYRRKDGMKALRHANELLHVALKSDALVKDIEREEWYDTLRHMQHMIDEELEFYNKI